MNPLHALLEAWKSGEVQPAPVCALLGIRLVSFGEGVAQMELVATPAHHNPFGIVHGGVLVDLADAAMGTALATVLAPGETFGTVDLHASYWRRVVEGRLVASARLLHRGKSTAHLECDLHEGQVAVARMAATCVVKRLE